MIDSHAIFGFFMDPRTTDLTRSTDPTDKKEGHEIDSFKGNLSKIAEFEKYSTKIVSLAGVLGTKMSKFYGTFGSRFCVDLNYPRWFSKMIGLARTRT